MGSNTLFFGFLTLLLVTITVAVAGVWRAAEPERRLRYAGVFGGVLVAAMGVSGAAAQAGLLARFDSLPPPAMIMLVGSTALSLAFALGPMGKRVASVTPIAWLIVFQAFRFPLELLLHRAWSDGVLPSQLTYSGLNFDIVTGVLALVVGLVGLERELPKWVAWAFNLIGLALLLNVVSIAIASLPLFQAFGPDRVNTGVLVLPYVWLPVVLVQFALIGHVLLWRALTSPVARDA